MQDLRRRLHTDAQHVFWIAVYFALDLSWIWSDQFAYRVSNVNMGAVLQGQACAPEQYRIAAPLAARFLATSLHLHSPIAGALVIDLLGTLLLSVLLYGALLASLSTASVAENVCAKAFLGLGMFFYLHWSFYSTRVDTVPCCLYVVVALLLLRSVQTVQRNAAAAACAMAFVSISTIQGWVRADVAVFLGGGVCVAALFGRTAVGQRRGWMLLAAGAVSTAVAGGAQLYLMKVAYPLAHYCGGVLALRFNVGTSFAYLSFLTLMPPLVWGAVWMGRRYGTLCMDERALLVAFCGYVVLWTTVGSWGEARIIAPFAMGLLPIVSLCMARWIVAATGRLSAVPV